MSEITKHDPGMFCWIELGTTDSEGSKRFYQQIFGWNVQDIPMGEGQFYTLLQIDSKDAAALYGLNSDQKAKGVPSHWMSYIAVDNVDEVASRVDKLGGKLLMKPFDVFEHGRMAILQDSAGATVSLWQAKEHIGVKLINQHGTLGWNELLTTDTEAAKKFYTQLLDWKAETQQMEDINYTLFKVGDKNAGGMMKIGKEMGQVPPHWMTYFLVDDCDGAADKAKSLGAQIVVKPTDIPSVGRFATIIDPQGAAFSVIKMFPQG